MAVDRNLFAYNLAIAAIMKGEAPYVKEWLDYHLLAGADHFYIYDNESPDNLKEILQPYIERGVVTYIFYPGKCRQMEAYNDAVRRFRFLCRYIAFIDGDEFIFPKSKPTVPEVVDELIGDRENVGGLAVNIFAFGSNNQTEEDLSRGVLERFTRRAETDWSPILPNSNLHGGNAHVKTITIPRKTKYFYTPHFATYWMNNKAVNEIGQPVELFSNYPVTANKIVMHHYSVKSLEEYKKKIQRGNADLFVSDYDMERFYTNDRNEVFDDSILEYRVARQKVASQWQGGGIDSEKLFNALKENLSEVFRKDSPLENFSGKLETFLTCRAVSAKLRENFLDETTANFFEEISLRGVIKSLSASVTLSDVELLLSELPEILKLNSSAAEEIRLSCMRIIPQVMDIFRRNNMWKNFMEMNYVLKMLQAFDGR